MVNRTKTAVVSVTVFAIAQLALLIYSFSHPNVNEWVIASFVMSTVVYPLIFAYQSRRIKASK